MQGVIEIWERCEYRKHFHGRKALELRQAVAEESFLWFGVFLSRSCSVNNVMFRVKHFFTHAMENKKKQ